MTPDELLALAQPDENGRLPRQTVLLMFGVAIDQLGKMTPSDAMKIVAQLEKSIAQIKDLHAKLIGGN